jgi:hypothetical protein
MVRRSLAINPHLRDGASTTAFLEKLRSQVASGETPPPTRHPREAAPTPATPSPSVGADARVRAVVAFLDDKQVAYHHADALMRDELSAIERRRHAARARCVDEIADMVVVALAAGADPTETSRALRTNVPLLRELGVTENEIVRRAVRLTANT